MVAIIYYVDGSAHPNPGPGGFGVVALDNNEKLLYTYSRQYDNKKVTNNEMELKAILFAVLDLIRRGESSIIYSDSAYAINCITNWAKSWECNNWLKSDNQIPENLDLIKNIYYLLNKYYNIITINKVKGHNNITYNEIADKLATGKIKGEGYQKI